MAEKKPWEIAAEQELKPWELAKKEADPVQKKNEAPQGASSVSQKPVQQPAKPSGQSGQQAKQVTPQQSGKPLDIQAATNLNPFAGLPGQVTQGEVKQKQAIPQAGVPVSQVLAFNQPGGAMAQDEKEAARGIVSGVGEKARAYEKLTAEVEKKRSELGALTVQPGVAGSGFISSFGAGNVYIPKTDRQKQDIAARERELDQMNQMLNGHISAMQGDVQSEVDRLITKSNYGNFTKESEGKRVPDEYKLDQAARSAARAVGVSEDGAYARYLRAQLRAGVEYRLIEPDVEKEYKKNLNNIFGTGDIEEIYSKKFGETKEVAEIVSKTEHEAKTLRSALSSAAKQEVEQASLRFKEFDNALKIEIENDQEVSAAFNGYYDALQKEIQTKYESGLLTLEQANEELASDRHNEEANKIRMQVIQKKYGTVIDEKLAAFYEEQNQINSKYNKQYQDKAALLESQAAVRLKEIGAKFELDKETMTKIKEAYKAAYGSVVERNEGNQIARQQGLSGALYTFGGAVKTSLGMSLESHGYGLGIKQLELFGQQVQNDQLYVQEEVKKFRDLFDGTKGVGAAGQMIGSSLTSLLPSTVVGFATGNLGTLGQLVAAGFAGWATETIDMVSRMRMDTFEKTGNMDTADLAASEMLTLQVNLMPAYGLEFLPFSNALKKIPLFGRVLAAGIVETATEGVGQEFPQNIGQKSIEETGTLSNILNYVNWEEFEQTMANVAAGSFIMGSGGAVVSSGKDRLAENIVKRRADSFVKKFGISEVAQSMSDQYIMNLLLAKKSPAFVKAVIGSQYTAGYIDKEQADGALRSVDRIASSMGALGGMKVHAAMAYNSLSSKLEAEKARLAEATDDSVKLLTETKIKAIEKEMTAVAGGGGDYLFVELPNSEKYVLTIEEALELAQQEDSPLWGIKYMPFVDQRKEEMQRVIDLITGDTPKAKQDVVAPAAASAGEGGVAGSVGDMPAVGTLTQDKDGGGEWVYDEAGAQVQTPTLSELNGKEVRYNGKRGVITVDEGGKVEFETENQIIEISDVNPAITRAGDIGISEYEQREYAQQDIEVSSDTDVSINGIQYTIQTDKKGNVLSLDPVVPGDPQILDERTLTQVEIARNQRISDPVVVEAIETRPQDVVRTAVETTGDATGFINVALNENMNDTVSAALDKLYDGDPLSEQEALQVEMWTMDAVERLEVLKKNNPESAEQIDRAIQGIYSIDDSLNKQKRDETKPKPRAKSKPAAQPKAEQKMAEPTVVQQPVTGPEKATEPTTEQPGESKELKDGATVELAPQIAGGSPRKMEYSDGRWMQRVGRELVDVGKGVQAQAQQAFDGTSKKDEAKKPSEPKPEPKAQPKTEPKVEPKAETKPKAAPEPKTEAPSPRPTDTKAKEPVQERVGTTTVKGKVEEMRARREGKKVEPKEPGEPKIYTMANSKEVSRDAKEMRGVRAELMKTIPNIIRAVSALIPNIKVVIHTDEKTYNAAIKRDGGSAANYGSLGYYYGDEKTININLTSPSLKSHTGMHEGIHAILQAIGKEAPGAIDALFKDLLSLAASFGRFDSNLNMNSKDSVFAFASHGMYSDSQRKIEAVVEFLARFASGKIRIPREQGRRKKLLDVVRRLITGIENLTGWKFGSSVISLPDSDLRKMAEIISDAFNSGRPVVAVKSKPVVGGRSGSASFMADNTGIDALPGVPQKRGATGPIPELVAAAEKYARENNIPYRRQGEYVEVDEARAKRIADAFEEMKHDPKNPKVLRAYEDLIRQTEAQYRALEEAGYQFYFFDPENDPYADMPGGFGNPWNAMRDLRANKRMAVYPTDEGYGDGTKADDFDVEDNPLLRMTDVKWPKGSPDGPLVSVRANDLFRAVHDAFGHGLEGAGFRARGEENAWQAHSRLFTGPAVGAITSETRGQNSWLNYGPHGEKNQTAKVEDTIFAEQKVGLMPEWTWKEGRAKDGPSFMAAQKPSGGAAFAKFFSEVENTKDGGAKINDVSEVLNLPIKGHEKELAAYMKYGSNFQKHIMASIPGFVDARIRVLKGMSAAAEVLGMQGQEVAMLDITSSEGYFTKAWAQLAQDRDVNATADALDALPDFHDSFYRLPQVEGVKFLLEAWGESFEDPKSGKQIPLFVPKKKYAMVYEGMGFQFFTPTRDKEIAEVKEMMTPDGLFVTMEKLKNPDYDRREVMKDEYKVRFFTKEQMAEKSKKVLQRDEENAVGMSDYQIDRKEYEKILSDNFDYVVQIWSSGNFAGYYASDSVDVINAALEETEDTTTVFSEEKSPTVIKWGNQDVSAPSFMATADDYISASAEAVKQMAKDESRFDLSVAPIDVAGIQKIIDDGGFVYLNEAGDAGAYVKSNGNIGGMFKNPGSKEVNFLKSVAPILFSKGGRYLDSYAGKLEDAYISAGFEPVARMRFNEEFAQPGWDAKGSHLKSKPDVVWYKYNPGHGKTAGSGIYFDRYEDAEMYAAITSGAVGPRIDGTKPLAPNGKPSNLTPRQWAQVRAPQFKNWFGDWEGDPENASKVVDENGEPMVVYHGSMSRFVEFDANRGLNGKYIYHASNPSVASHWSGTDTPVIFNESILDDLYEMKTVGGVIEYLRNYAQVDAEIYESYTTKEAAKTYGVEEGMLTGVSFEYKGGLSSSGPLRLGDKKRDLTKEEILQAFIKEAAGIIGQGLYGNGAQYANFLNIKKPLVVNAKKSAYHNISFDGKRVTTGYIANKAFKDGYDGVIIKDVLETDYENKLTDDFLTSSPTQIKSATDNSGAFSPTDPRISFMAAKEVEQGLGGKALTLDQFGIYQRAEREYVSSVAKEARKFVNVFQLPEGRTLFDLDVMSQFVRGILKSDFTAGAIEGYVEGVTGVRMPGNNEIWLPMGKVEERLNKLFLTNPSPTSEQLSDAIGVKGVVVSDYTTIRSLFEQAIDEYGVYAGWYSEIGREAAKIVGKANLPEFGAIWGVTSAQTPVADNLHTALWIMANARLNSPLTESGAEAFRHSVASKMPTGKKPFVSTGIRKKDQYAEMPALFDLAEGKKKITVQSQIDRMIGFYGGSGYTSAKNIKTFSYSRLTVDRGMGGFNPFTVQDTHMMRFWAGKSETATGASKESVARGLGNANIQRAFMYLTSRLAMDFNMRPDEVQSVAWFFAKHKYGEAAGSGTLLLPGISEQAAIPAIEGSIAEAMARPSTQKMLSFIEEVKGRGIFDTTKPFADTVADPRFGYISTAKGDNYSTYLFKEELKNIALGRYGGGNVVAKTAPLSFMAPKRIEDIAKSMAGDAESYKAMYDSSPMSMSEEQARAYNAAVSDFAQNRMATADDTRANIAGIISGLPVVPKTVDDILAVINDPGSRFALLTPENTNAGGSTKSANAPRFAEAMKWFRENGRNYNFVVVGGKYDKSEYSFFVEGMSDIDVLDFINTFDQDSAATHSGLIYRDGSRNDRVRENRVVATKERPANYFTAFKGLDGVNYFAIDYNMSEKVFPQYGGVKLYYDKNNRHLAPNGRPSLLPERVAAMVRTPQFKNWFGDWEFDPENASKVVDENGEPRIVYHGTNEDFDEFMQDKLGSKNFLAESAYTGFFFAGTKETSKAYTGMNNADFAGMKMFNPEIIDSVVNKYRDQLDKAEGAIKSVVDRELGRYKSEVMSTHKETIDRIKESGAYDSLISGLTASGYSGDMDAHILRLVTGNDAYDVNIPYERAAEINDSNGNTRRMEEINLKIYDEVEKEFVAKRGIKPRIMELFLNIKNPYRYDYANKAGEAIGLTENIKAAKKEGRDGVMFSNLADGAGVDDIFVVFGSNDIKSATENVGTYNPENNNIRFMAAMTDVVDGFYSPLEDQIARAKQDKMPAKQWLDKFANTEEAKWTGLRDWLSGQPGSLSKKEILDWLKDNRVEIKIIEKGGEVAEADIDALLADELGQGMTREEAREYLSNDEENSQARHSGLQLSGDKSNYKEVLVTLPKKTGKGFVEQNEDGTFSIRKVDGTLTSKKWVTFEEADRYNESATKSMATDFKSTHFDEPNILVHLRMNTRTDAEGNKILFLEEVQSDWGQTGKRDGFITPQERHENEVYEKDVAEWNRLRGLIAEERESLRVSGQHQEDLKALKSFGIYAWTGLKEFGEKNTVFTKSEDIPNSNDLIEESDLPPGFIAVRAKIQERVRSLKKLESERDKIEAKYGITSNVFGEENIKHPDSYEKAYKAVSSAPFVMDTNSWVKLGLKVALKEAVNQGADKIAWTTGEQQNDRYDLSKQVDEIDAKRNKDGSYEVTATKDGSSIFGRSDMSIKNIEDTFGKDVAEKIGSSEGRLINISGDNLKAGGKGMIGFYGSPSEGKLGIVGNVAKSLFKQEPKTVSIETAKNNEYNLGEANYVGGIGVYDGNGDMIAEFDTKQEADNFIANKTNQIQHSIDITPELKASVKSGQPMFMAAGPKYDPMNAEHREMAGYVMEYVNSAAVEGVVPSLEDFRDSMGQENYDFIVGEIGVDYVNSLISGDTGSGQVGPSPGQVVASTLADISSTIGGIINSSGVLTDRDKVSMAGSIVEASAAFKQENPRASAQDFVDEVMHQIPELEAYFSPGMLKAAYNGAVIKPEDITLHQILFASGSGSVTRAQRTKGVIRRRKKYNKTGPIAEAIAEMERRYNKVSAKQILKLAERVAKEIKAQDVGGRLYEAVFDWVERDVMPNIADEANEATVGYFATTLRELLLNDVDLAENKTLYKQLQDRNDRILRGAGRVVAGAGNNPETSQGQVGQMYNDIKAAQSTAMESTGETGQTVGEEVDGVVSAAKAAAKRAAADAVNSKQMDQALAGPDTSATRVDVLKQKAKDLESRAKEVFRKMQGKTYVGIPPEMAELAAIGAEWILTKVEERAITSFGAIRKAFTKAFAFLDDEGIDANQFFDDIILENPDISARVLENRAKAALAMEDPKNKRAVDMLIDALWKRMADAMPITEEQRETQKRRAKNNVYKRVKELLEQEAYGDSAISSAVAEVKSAIENLVSDPARAQEMKNAVEDIASAFMSEPISDSDVRAIARDSMQERKVQIRDIIADPERANELYGSIEAAVVAKTGLPAHKARKVADLVRAEIKGRVAKAQLKAMANHLGLEVDDNGNLVAKANKDNKMAPVYAKVAKMVNMGMLANNAIMNAFAAKYGFKHMTPSQARRLARLNSALTNMEKGEGRQRIIEEMLNIMQDMEETTSKHVFEAMNGGIVMGLLTGVLTLGRIAWGSVLAVGPKALIHRAMNPTAYREANRAWSELQDMGVGGAITKQFSSIMRDGFSSLDDIEVIAGEKDISRPNRLADKINRSYDRMIEAMKRGDMKSAIGLAMQTAYIKGYQLSYFSKAFDVLINRSFSEKLAFVMEWKAVAKEMGVSEEGIFMDAADKLKIINEVRRRMGYVTDPSSPDHNTIRGEHRKLVELVDIEIGQLRATGMKIPFGYRERRIHEAMYQGISGTLGDGSFYEWQGRDKEVLKSSFEIIKTQGLMGNPGGILGGLWMNLRYKPGTGINIVAENIKNFTLNVAFGLFLRIALVSGNRMLNETPVIGLLTSPFSFRTRDVIEDGKVKRDPEGNIVTKTQVFKSAEEIKIDVVNNMINTGIAVAAFMAMFKFEDEDDEEEKKIRQRERDTAYRKLVAAKKIKKTMTRAEIEELVDEEVVYSGVSMFGYKVRWREDAPIFFTGSGGDYFEQDERGKKYAENSIYVRINGEAKRLGSYRLSPNMMPIATLLGNEYDNQRYAKKQEIKEEDATKFLLQFFGMINDMSFAGTTQFMEKVIKDYNKNTTWDGPIAGMLSIGKNFGDQLMKSMKQLLPFGQNVYRNLFETAGSIAGQPVKEGTFYEKQALRNYLFLDEILLSENIKVDRFGIPIIKANKLKEFGFSFTANALGMGEDLQANRERFNDPKWKLATKYDDVVIPTMYWDGRDKKLTKEEKGELSNNVAITYGKELDKRMSSLNRMSPEVLQRELDRVYNDVVKKERDKILERKRL